MPIDFRLACLDDICADSHDYLAFKIFGTQAKKTKIDLGWSTTEDCSSTIILPIIYCQFYYFQLLKVR